MKENRRRFRTALFGVIAAVVGIGWAAYFFLDIGLDSYRVREGITREQYAAGLERRG